MLNVLMAVSLTFAFPSQAPDVLPELRAPSADVVRTYDELRSMPRTSRTQALARMPSSAQSAIWTHHLLTTMVQHPEFTTEQRAVIQEALSLLTPELFEIDPSNRRWVDVVDLPLRRLKERAITAFPDRAFARDLFTQLGPDSELLQPATGRPRSIQTNSEDCSCNVISDWCYTGFACKNTWCNFKNAGCGTLLRYSCDGLCFMKAH